MLFSSRVRLGLGLGLYFVSGGKLLFTRICASSGCNCHERDFIPVRFCSMQCSSKRSSDIIETENVQTMFRNFCSTFFWSIPYNQTGGPEKVNHDNNMCTRLTLVLNKNLISWAGFNLGLNAI